jgi:hypothetical protein
MQVEYATDIIFKERDYLNAIYEPLIRTAIHSVKPENIATFLGRKLHPAYQGEMGNNFNTRSMGTRIKHQGETNCNVSRIICVCSLLSFWIGLIKKWYGQATSY